MSDLLTTGQMIDRLKVGEVAECIEGVLKGIRLKKFISKDSGQFYLAREDGSDFHISLIESYLNCKWRIIPEFVTFDKAMVALMEGKTVWAWEDGEIFIGYYIDKETGKLWGITHDAEGATSPVTHIGFYKKWMIGE